MIIVNEQKLFLKVKGLLELKLQLDWRKNKVYFQSNFGIRNMLPDQMMEI